MPPISPSQTDSPKPTGLFRVAEGPIDLAELTASVADTGSGATTTFLGTTRATNRGRIVEKLEYEAYADMAVSEFESIAAQAHSRWEISAASIVHRIGVVPLGEASVAIAVSAPHRRESIEACHYLIDALKVVAPIWKKEHFEGGEVWIGSLADCDHGHDEEADGAEGLAHAGPKVEDPGSAHADSILVPPTFRKHGPS
jgi:molybdopterin synthase catalytic subunit